MKWILFLALSFAACLSLAGTRGGSGGMDSGGGSGLSFRLERARNFALQVVATVLPKDLQGVSSEMVQFYSKHRSAMTTEIKNATFIIKPPYEVFLDIQGRKVFKSMTTPLQPMAPITISESVRSEDVAELAANLLHEVGHHFGIPQSQDAFLDAISTLLVDTALKLDPKLNSQTKSCLTGEEILELSAGTWEGMVSFKPAGAPYPVVLTLEKNGHYSGRSVCKDNSACPQLFYYASDKDHPDKMFQFSNSCSEAPGQVALVFDTGVTRYLDLKVVRLSPDAQTLEFHVIFPNAVFPIEVKLKRKK